MRCFCGLSEKEPEQSLYVVDGVACCTPGCFKAALAARRPSDQPKKEKLPDYSWDVV